MVHVLRLGMVSCAIALLTACAGASPAQPVAAMHAADIFERACARCHGSDGRGGLPMVANGPRPIDLRDADWQRTRRDDEIVGAIRDGRGAMPPFHDVLTGSEIAAVAAYVRELAQQPDRQATP
jgi:mono/diheme cytochrome c family protein